jgi:hypothetical protein
MADIVVNPTQDIHLILSTAPAGTKIIFVKGNYVLNQSILFNGLHLHMNKGVTLNSTGQLFTGVINHHTLTGSAVIQSGGINYRAENSVFKCDTLLVSAKFRFHDSLNFNAREVRADVETSGQVTYQSYNQDGLIAHTAGAENLPATFIIQYMISGGFTSLSSKVFLDFRVGGVLNELPVPVVRVDDCIGFISVGNTPPNNTVEMTNGSKVELQLSGTTPTINADPTCTVIVSGNIRETLESVGDLKLRDLTSVATGFCLDSVNPISITLLTDVNMLSYAEQISANITLIEPEIQGEGTWGAIVGNINDQADLQAQFDTKEDYLNLPPSNGWLLASTVAGVRTWVSPTGGSTVPDGDNMDVQYNNNGSFGGIGFFTYNDATGVLTSPALKLSNTAPSVDPTAKVMVREDASTNVIQTSLEISDVATSADLDNKEDYLQLPAANDYMLISSTAGVRSWVAPNYTQAAGNNYEIQVNVSGSFGTFTGFLYRYDQGALVVPLINMTAQIDSDDADLIVTRSPSTNYITVSDLEIGAVVDHIGDVTGNPHEVNKAQVGLSAADNTSDANKPISNATQSALNAKEDSLGNPVTSGYILSSTNTGIRNWIPPSTGGGGTPAGSDGWIQYNDNGAFGASTQLQFNKLNGLFTASRIALVSTITVDDADAQLLARRQSDGTVGQSGIAVQDLQGLAKDPLFMSKFANNVNNVEINQSDGIGNLAPSKRMQIQVTCMFSTTLPQPTEDLRVEVFVVYSATNERSIPIIPADSKSGLYWIASMDWFDPNGQTYTSIKATIYNHDGTSMYTCSYIKLDLLGYPYIA